jgi:hypothetical protein
MQAQVVLIPDESKKFIIKALLAMRAVKTALKKGIVAVHPSSTTLFLYEALVGRFPDAGEHWVSGLILPRGLCVSRHSIERMASQDQSMKDPLENRNAWVFKKGQLQEKMRLGDILDQMSPDDVYVKGPNAIDSKGNIGVLYANPAGGGGTIGRVLGRARKTGFHFLFPAGIEKLIPVSVKEASKKAGFKRVKKAMGMPCGMIPIPASLGQKIDETDAVRILSGAEATPIAAGGLGGAGGAVVLGVSGTKAQVNRAVGAVESVKGTRLPPLDLLQCAGCPNPNCHQRGLKGIPWLEI